ncbi:hypothetical protein MK079_03715 [Candidatus Gracilibacteria bacterium]|nr:hypothetical protein [Candidatus Gracilibacteria bacterium]
MERLIEQLKVYPDVQKLVFFLELMRQFKEKNYGKMVDFCEYKQQLENICAASQHLACEMHNEYELMDIRLYLEEKLQNFYQDTSLNQGQEYVYIANSSVNKFQIQMDRVFVVINRFLEGSSDILTDDLKKRVQNFFLSDFKYATIYIGG